MVIVHPVGRRYGRQQHDYYPPYSPCTVGGREYLTWEYRSHIPTPHYYRGREGMQCSAPYRIAIAAKEEEEAWFMRVAQSSNVRPDLSNTLLLWSMVGDIRTDQIWIL